METVKSRSESPFSKNKPKSSLSDAPENGNTVIEQIKTKKKSLRNKSKAQANGKENDDISSNGKDFFEEEKPTQNEVDNNVDSNNSKCENGIDESKNTENSNVNEEASQQDVTEKENDAMVNVCESTKEKILIESGENSVKNNISTECKNTEVITTLNIEEDCMQGCSTVEVTETESSAKKSNSVPHDSLPEFEVLHENAGEKASEQKNDFSNEETNSVIKKEEAGECSEMKESSQVSVNGSDDSSHYEEANKTENYTQESPDTATKDDVSVTNKITSFLGMWSYSQEPKLDSEVSSSKKIEEVAFNHPYLSKVSGRRGIKDRLNSSATVFSSKDLEAKTPENPGISLNDSFRVRTNPTRLNSLDLKENSSLRKFKGKRCLNDGDEPEEEDDLYFNTMKRRKLNEKAQEPGLLGSILWSPFKKKSYSEENQLKFTTAESKLSRLLSPFWFWKKRAAGQKGK